MSHNDFVEKLRDFFDPAQIENLEKFAEESAYDAFGDDSWTDDGRDYVCDLLYDYMGEEYPESAASIENIACGIGTEEEYFGWRHVLDAEVLEHYAGVQFVVSDFVNLA